MNRKHEKIFLQCKSSTREYNLVNLVDKQGKNIGKRIYVDMTILMQCNKYQEKVVQTWQVIICLFIYLFIYLYFILCSHLHKENNKTLINQFKINIKIKTLLIKLPNFSDLYLKSRIFEINQFYQTETSKSKCFSGTINIWIPGVLYIFYFSIFVTPSPFYDNVRTTHMHARSCMSDTRSQHSSH